MIVVMPNGRAAKQDRPGGDFRKQFPAFEVFENDLLKDVIPFVESHYPVKSDREHRALAGLSMGGGQSLNFGLKHPGTFAWVGGFSSAPNTKPAGDLVKDPAALARELRLLWVSCGNQDRLIDVSERFHSTLEKKNVPHVWHVDSGAHYLAGLEKRPLLVRATAISESHLRRCGALVAHGDPRPPIPMIGVHYSSLRILRGNRAMNHRHSSRFVTLLAPLAAVLAARAWGGRSAAAAHAE